MTCRPRIGLHGTGETEQLFGHRVDLAVVLQDGPDGDPFDERLKIAGPLAARGGGTDQFGDLGAHPSAQQGGRQLGTLVAAQRGIAERAAQPGLVAQCGTDRDESVGIGLLQIEPIGHGVQFAYASLRFHRYCVPAPSGPASESGT